jgi:PAS domain-containing protein
VMGGSHGVNELVRCPKGNVHRVQFSSSYYVFLDGFDRRWLAVSKSFASLLGHDPKRLVGVTAQQMMLKGKYKPNFFEQLLQNESLEIPYVFRHRDGSEIRVMGSVRVLEDGCIVGIARPSHKR